MAPFVHASTSHLSLLSGVKRKSDFEARMHKPARGIARRIAPRRTHRYTQERTFDGLDLRPKSLTLDREHRGKSGNEAARFHNACRWRRRSLAACGAGAAARSRAAH